MGEKTLEVCLKDVQGACNEKLHFYVLTVELETGL